MAVQTTERYKKAVQNNARTWRLKLTVHPDSELEPIQLTETDVTLGSFVFEEASIGSDMLDVGATYSNSLQFALENTDHRFSGLSLAGAKVFAYVGLLLEPEEGEETETWEDIPLGEFFVQEDGKKMSTIPLNCLDRMVVLNTPVKRRITTALTTGKELAESIRQQYGFSVVPATQELLDTLDEPLDTEVMADDMTCRDFLGYCAACFGMNTRFDRMGRLEFFRHHIVTEGETDGEPGGSVVVTTPDTRLAGFSFSDRLIRVDGVTVKDGYGNEVSLPAKVEPEREGESEPAEEGYRITVEANPLLVTEQAAADAAQRIYDMYIGTPYLAYSTGIIGDPSIQAGDPVRHLAVNGTERIVDSIITKHVFKFRGSCSLAAEGKPAEENRQLTATNKKIIEVSMNASRDLNDRIWTMDEMMQMQFSTVVNSLGFYTKAIRDEETGAIKQFLIQDTDPASDVAPSCIWGFDGEKFYSEVDGYKTFGITADGSVFAQRVLAKYLKTGSIEAEDGSVRIDLDNGVIANRTIHGSTELSGETVLIKYMDDQNDAYPSAIRLMAGRREEDGAYTAAVQFLDKNGAVLSGLSQGIRYGEDGKTTAEPLTASDLRVKSSLEIDNAIVYDRIQLQRKAGEEGNTGVDFVIVGG